MKKNFIIMSFFILIGLICFNPAFAQKEMRISSSPNPVGSGARALGMGGAFIGVADDATAASWNPGGLVQLPTPEISVVLNGFHRTENNSFGSNPEAGGTQSVTKEAINYLSFVYPFNLFNRNMVISLNYQNQYDFTREWNFPVTYSEESEFIGKSETRENVQYEQKGNLFALGIAYSVQIIPEFTFGFTLNIWDNNLTGNQWETKTISNGITDYSLFGTSSSYLKSEKDKYLFSGFNANIGILFRPTKKINIGAVLKLPFKADLEHEKVSESFTNNIAVVNMKTVTDEKMDMPMSYGLGFAYRFSDKLTLSTDIYRTEWDEFIITDSNGNETSAITGKSTDLSKSDPTHHLRFGTEYLFINPELNYVIPLRAGIFYDPVPSEGSPDDYYGFSMGTGISVGKFVFDIAYQYRFGNNVGDSIISNYGFSQDVKEHTVYSSLIIHF